MIRKKREFPASFQPQSSPSSSCLAPTALASRKHVSSFNQGDTADFKTQLSPNVIPMKMDASRRRPTKYIQAAKPPMFPERPLRAPTTSHARYTPPNPVIPVFFVPSGHGARPDRFSKPVRSHTQPHTHKKLCILCHSLPENRIKLYKLCHPPDSSLFTRTSNMPSTRANGSPA